MSARQQFFVPRPQSRAGEEDTGATSAAQGQKAAQQRPASAAPSTSVPTQPQTASPMTSNKPLNVSGIVKKNRSQNAGQNLDRGPPRSRGSASFALVSQATHGDMRPPQIHSPLAASPFVPNGLLGALLDDETYNYPFKPPAAPSVHEKSPGSAAALATHSNSSAFRTSLDKSHTQPVHIPNQDVRISTSDPPTGRIGVNSPIPGGGMRSLQSTVPIHTQEHLSAGYMRPAEINGPHLALQVDLGDELNHTNGHKRSYSHHPEGVVGYETDLPGKRHKLTTPANNVRTLLLVLVVNTPVTVRSLTFVHVLRSRACTRTARTCSETRGMPCQALSS
jgi:hypothetical protein